MGSVIIAGVIEISEALGVRCTSGKQTLRWIRLVPAQQALQHVMRRRENVSHIVKDGKTEPLAKIGQRNRRQPQFEIIHKQCRAAHRKARCRIARSRLI